MASLNKEDKMIPDISDLLLSLKTDKSRNKEIKNVEDESATKIEENRLFDIKKLNDIEDKMIRGTVKKIYMSGKRNNLSSEAVVNDMIKQLTDLDKMDDSLLELLKGLI